MLGRFQITPNDVGRLTSGTTLPMLQALIDKLPNGMFWYEATSGATTIYTNREVRTTATIAVWVRGDSRCAVMFPFGTQVPYIMWRYGAGTEWNGFYKYGSEVYATIGDMETVNTAIENINGNITNIEGDISGLQTQVQTNTQNITNLQGDLDSLGDTVESNTNRISQLETTVGNHTTEISNLDGRVDSLESTVGNHTTEISNLDGRTDTLETTVENQGTEISNLDGRTDTLETTTANHTQELSSIDDRVEVIEGVIDPERMGYAQYSFTVQNGGLAELFPGGYSTSDMEITRFYVTMSSQICNISMTIQLKRSLSANSTMLTPTMSENGFYTSQADNGKVYLGKNTSTAGSYPTFELLTYNSILRNTTGTSISTGSQIQTSFSLVVAPTFKSLATRWAAYRVKNPV